MAPKAHRGVSGDGAAPASADDDEERLLATEVAKQPAGEPSAHSEREPAPRLTSNLPARCVVDLAQHPIAIILNSLPGIKEVAFSIKRIYFYDYPNFKNLPERVRGECNGWVNTGERLRVIWPIDESNTLENLDELLKLGYGFKWEKFGSKAPPKPRGDKAKAAFALAVAPSAPYRSAIVQEEVHDDDEDETIEVKYKEGNAEYTQVWVKRPPQYVSIDWRHSDNFRAKMKEPKNPKKFDSLEKMLLSGWHSPNPSDRDARLVQSEDALLCRRTDRLNLNGQGSTELVDHWRDISMLWCDACLCHVWW